jgi:hypothetical protein
MSTAFDWHESYRVALLETDWTKMQERLLAAESEIRKRKHVLLMDHGGTPEERQAIADALNGMKSLQAEVAEWQVRQVPDGKARHTGLDRLPTKREAKSIVGPQLRLHQHRHNVAVARTFPAMDMSASDTGG